MEVNWEYTIALAEGSFAFIRESSSRRASIFVLLWKLARSMRCSMLRRARAVGGGLEGVGVGEVRLTERGRVHTGHMQVSLPVVVEEYCESVCVCLWVGGCCIECT